MTRKQFFFSFSFFLNPSKIYFSKYINLEIKTTPHGNESVNGYTTKRLYPVCWFYLHCLSIKALNCLQQKCFWRLLFSGLRGCWSHALSAVWLHLPLSWFSVKPRLAQGRSVFSNVHTATIKGYLDSFCFMSTTVICACFGPRNHRWNIFWFYSLPCHVDAKANSALLHFSHWRLSGSSLWGSCCHSDSTR